MRVDPRVSIRKFQAQMDLLSTRSEGLRAKRCQIVKSKYPHVDFVLYPAGAVIHPDFHALFPNANGPYQVEKERFAPGKINLLYPYLTARSFGIRFDFSDFDQRPPAISFHDPLTWDFLGPDQVPPALVLSTEAGARNVVINSHPATKRPFLCMRYIREYHEHPQHTDDPWVRSRKHFSLPSLADQIAEAFIRPIPVVGLGFFPHDKPSVMHKE